MAKARTKTSFFCQQCGTESLKWVGRCPGCGEWNTMVEELKPTKAEQRRGFVASESMAKPQRLQEIETKEEARIQTSMSELNRVLDHLFCVGVSLGLGNQHYFYKRHKI